VVVRLHGELDMGTRGELAPLRNTIMRKPSEVVLDLTELSFVDSAGLRGLLNGGRIAEESAVPFRCVNPRPNIRRLFEITGLTDILHVE